MHPHDWEFIVSMIADRWSVDSYSNKDYSAMQDTLSFAGKNSGRYTGAHKKVIQEIMIMASVRRGWKTGAAFIC